MKYIVVREYSGVTAQKVLWQVLSRELESEFDANNWADFMRDEYGHLKGKVFVIARNSD